MPPSESSFERRPTLPDDWLWFWRPVYAVRSAWRHFRISRIVTLLLGPQYRRSRDKIEIDITYACNLRCLNCNRSVTQAPDRQHITMARIVAFVNDSIASQRRWRRIRVLGGEPTLHPEFLAIIEELRRYRAWNPKCIIEVVTNGNGDAVAATLADLPPDIWIENSRKTSPIQPHFGPFNMAPVDDPCYVHAEYSNGCAIMEECGMGLTPGGYYPCAVAGGIDRIAHLGLGSESMPGEADDMLGAARKLCQLCGRFRAGHFVPRNLRPPLTDAQVSPTWTRLYAEWRRRKADHGGAIPHESPPSAQPGKAGTEPTE